MLKVIAACCTGMFMGAGRAYWVTGQLIKGAYGEESIFNQHLLDHGDCIHSLYEQGIAIE